MKFDKVYIKTLKYFPDTKIKFKNESLFMKLLSFLLFFNPKFYTNYITTIGDTIYFPSKESLYKNEDSSIYTFLHEVVHINDYHNNKLFKFNYLFPQILFLPCLLLLLLSWKIWLVSFIFLLPLPAYFRARYELKAYLAGLYVKSKLFYVDYNDEVEKIYKHFNSGDYYFMYPFNSLREELKNSAALIKDNEYDFDLRNKFDDIIRQ